VRIIHVCGLSGSGKTTLIRSLIPLLKERGPVAVVKHLGHHAFTLEEGKDTTFFIQAGASVSAGIDETKAVIITDQTHLRTVLDTLCILGMASVVVEGYKTLPLPKVIVGGVPGAENVVLDNPTPEEIIDSLGEFPEYISRATLARALETGERVVMTCGIPLNSRKYAPPVRREFYQRFLPILSALSREDPSMKGGGESRVHLHQGLYFGDDDRVIFAVGAPTAKEAFLAFSLMQTKILAAIAACGPSGPE